MEGFIGGSCSRDIVRRQALASLENTKPCMLHIHPDADGPTPRSDSENFYVSMGCVSEGAVDVYIEPHFPPRTLLVAGATPVADALARVGVAIGDRVVRVVDRSELAALPQTSGATAVEVRELREYLSMLSLDVTSRLVAVVASQGHYDEAVLEVLLPHPVSYIGLLASRRRTVAVLSVLAQQAVDTTDLERIHAPVGLDIGARMPADIAISILAEIVSVTKDTVPNAAIATAPAAAIDPVCKMDVQIEGARHTLERAGTTLYFCCPGCKSSFAADPDRYFAPSRR